jgi:signal transduction histidine kinase
MRRLRPTVRVRLTALYAVLFGACVAVLLIVSYWLLGRHLERTLPDAAARDALSEVGIQYAIAFAGTLILATALGWAMAGRALSPIARITRAARRVSDDRLDERIDLQGPADELRDLADTFDSMLDRLAESFDGQRRFIANASHELRGPLTVIRSEAEVALANPETDPEELRAMAEVVIEATRRTEALLESLLILARSQRGLLRREPVDLAWAARAAASAVSAEARAEDVHVALDAAPSPATGDRRLLERLAANLLENAVRHNHRGGSVAVSTELSEGRARLRVANTGPRIEATAAQRLAEPFQRLGRDGDGGGAGLGLSIVRSVAEAHGGALAIEARAEGGLEVEVTLPGDYRELSGAGARSSRFSRSRQRPSTREPSV